MRNDWEDFYYGVVSPARLWLAKLIGGEPVRHCLHGYERALALIDQERAKDEQAVEKEWTR